MPTINQITIKGNLCRDPELSYTSGGTAKATFSIGVTSQWKDKDGAKKEKAEFFSIIAWKKTAEAVTEHCKKGRELIIFGRLCWDKWEDKEKAKHTKTYIIATQIYFGRLPGTGNPEKAPGTDTESPEGDTAQDGAEENIPF